MENKTILIADDEIDIREFVKYNLVKEGYVVHTASNGAETIKKTKEIKPDLILLDIMMPDIDGIEVCRELRELPEFKSTLIAFLTARPEDYSQIAGYEAGGDDYIKKPIRPKVLVSRISALLRRKYKYDADRIEPNKDLIYGDIIIDLEKYTFTKNKEAIVLTKKEFEIISLLISKPGKVFKREEIYNKTWGANLIVGDRTIDVHIRKLREKIGDDLIKTIKGIGYKVEDLF
jgi:two-component system, OmpR family, alkaline phosphatase synthesis response regulator PhoP